jgi:hypothetical protein
VEFQKNNISKTNTDSIMKQKLILTGILSLLIFGTNIYGQNILNGSNMEDASKWTEVSIGAATGTSHVQAFNYTASKPTGATGGCLRLTGAASASGLVNTAIYQQITLKKNVYYKADLLFKDQSSDLTDLWFQAYLRPVQPTAGVDFSTVILKEFNTWNGCAKGVDGLMSAYGCGGVGLNFKLGTSSGDTTVWFVLKWGTMSTSPYDLLVDDVSIVRLQVENIKVTASKPLVAVGQNLQVLADVSPSIAPDTSVTWGVVNHSGTATISPAGMLSCLTVGSVTVRATANDGSGVFGELDINILDQVILADSIKVSGASGINSITTDKGTLQMMVDVFPSGTTQKSVKWSLTNVTGFATINESGMLTANYDGTVKVNAITLDGSNKSDEKVITISNQMRDAWLWPFSHASIWNTPIGSDAVYEPANLQAASFIGADVERHIVTTEDDPYRIIYQPTSWSPRWPGYSTNDSMRVPDNLIIPDAYPGNTPNECSSFLESNGRYIIQLEPTCRAEAGKHIVGYKWPEKMDIYGEGIGGTHWGSGLSTLGGSIRKGELTGDQPIRHAVKMNIWGNKYLYYSSQIRGFRWPASMSDNYASSNYKGTNPKLVQGALLAIPPDIDLNSLGLETKAAKLICKALQDYGAYISDDAGWDAHYFPMEIGVMEEVAQKEGISLGSGKFFNDINKIVKKLKIVDNNTPASIGGGGTPRTNLALPFKSDLNDPSAIITMPLNNQTFLPSTPITINAIANDPGGNVTKVEFYNGNQLLGYDETSPFTFTWGNLAVGTYSITAKATDNNGGTTISSNVTFKVSLETGLETENSSGEPFTVSPNPIQQNQSFSINYNGFINPYMLKICNMNGMLVHEELISKPNATISTTGLSSGLFLIIAFDGKKYFYKKIIIN